MENSPRERQNAPTRRPGAAQEEKDVLGKSVSGGQYLSYLCDECETVCKNQETLESHKKTHEMNRSKITFICDDCDQECESDNELKCHMAKEHDDGGWTCEDCHYQANSSELLRQHLKAKGHQPSESAKRQTNEIKTC